MCLMNYFKCNLNRNRWLNKNSTLTSFCRTLSSQNTKLPQNAYQPKNVESTHPKLQHISNPAGKFSMIFPPPNVTGNIHLGHVLTATIQDVLVRWKNKQNLDTLWIPGTDHAGIATQVVVEKILQKEFGKGRHELGRDKFLEKVWEWKKDKGNSIAGDLKKLGTSFSWEREYFTMSENLSGAVNEAFVRLFEKGLIYREKSLVNWSCCLESAISDIEVENLEIQGPTSIAVPNYEKNITFGQIFEFSYKVEGSNEEIVVSTTRPETVLGDVAVAVHPKDPRYVKYRNTNTKLVHPFRNELIPLIFDDYADPEFGTGAVKITPSHDKNDFLVAKRHNLPHCQVINEKGNVIEGFQGFSQLPRFEAREKVLNSLGELGLLKGVKSHNMVLPICSRSKDVIEFLLRSQWFLKCDEMASRAVKAVKTGELKIIPSNFEDEWFRWLENSRDWCISRQLWWGHQIPAYKIKSDQNEFWVAARNLEEAQEKAFEKLKSKDFSIVQDQDVLDTWFSSGILPFSVFNWPQNTENFQKYFPLDLMETGHDIIFFWVARMVMLSQELTGKLPFNKILLHGIICDAQGRKMSKSLGNVIVPEQVIKGISLENLQKEAEKSFQRGILSESEMRKTLEGQKKMFPKGIPECGTDALRFTLCSSNIKNHFINFDIQECYTNKLFFNKIWQATKYTIQSADSLSILLKDVDSLETAKLSDMDRWILGRLRDTKETVEKSLEDYNFHLATQSLKSFFYNNFCDIYLETTKKDMSKHQEACKVLAICLSSGLDLMECFTPFLSQELKKFLPQNFKVSLEDFKNVKLEENVGTMLEICACIRQLKNEMNITRNSNATVHLLLKSPDNQKFLENHINDISCLTFSDIIKFSSNSNDFDSNKFAGKSTAGHTCSFGITVDGKLEKSGNDHQINVKKLEKLEQELLKLEKTVSNEGYQKSASSKVKEKHLEKINQLKTEIASIRRIRN